MRVSVRARKLAPPDLLVRERQRQQGVPTRRQLASPSRRLYALAVAAGWAFHLYYHDCT